MRERLFNAFGDNDAIVFIRGTAKPGDAHKRAKAARVSVRFGIGAIAP
jgi:hypothetical protein